MLADAAGVAARVRAALAAAQPQQALTLAREWVEGCPDDAEAQVLLGICLGELDQAEAALDAFARARALSPDSEMALLNCARLLRRLGRRDEGVSLLRQAVRAHPASYEAWSQLGAAELELGQPGAAVAPLRQALALAPARAGDWHALGTALRRQGALVEAEGALRRAVTLAPGDAVAWVNLGGVCRMLGRLAEARQAYLAARAAGFDTPELADALNGVALDAGEVEQAFDGARSLVARHPGYAGGHDTLVRLLWEHGERLAPGRDPFVDLHVAAEAEPRNMALQRARLRLLLEARRPELALPIAQRLHRTAPEEPAWLWCCADAHDQLGEGATASRLYAHLDRYLGAHSTAFLNAHARQLFRSGDWALAGRQAERATRLLPTDQEAWSHLATWWRLDGDPREAWLCRYESLIGVVDVPPPAGCDEGDFLRALERVLVRLHSAGREPINQSVRGGSQTSGRLFGRREPLIALAAQALLEAAARWCQALPEEPDHPFLSRRADRVHAVGSWSVRLWSSGRHANHIHPEGWMSSAFYVALPPSVAAAAEHDAGCLQFGQPLDELGLALAPRRIVRPRAGALALFPSYLWHGTVPFEDTQPRLTIAFDMQPGA